MLQDYFNTRNLPKTTKKLLALGVISSIVGKTYTIDETGLDLALCVSDDLGEAMRHIVELRDVVAGLDAKIHVAAEISVNSLATKVAQGSTMVVSNLKYMRANDRNSSRRKFYKSSAEHSGPDGKLEYAEEGRKYAIPSPALTSLLLDDFGKIRTYLKSGPDSFFERYVFALERPADKPVDTLGVRAEPDAATVQYLATLMSISRALESAGTHLAVAWTKPARKYFDKMVDARWRCVDHPEMYLGAYKKAKKVAALLAVYKDPHAPCIDRREVDEALKYLDNERAARSDEDEQKSMYQQRIDTVYVKACAYLDSDYLKVAGRNTNERLHGFGMVSRAYLLNQCQNLVAFNKAPGMSRKQACQQAVDQLVKDGRFTVLPWNHMLTRTSEKGRVFSDILYVHGYALERISEWQDANPEHSARDSVVIGAL